MKKTELQSRMFPAGNSAAVCIVLTSLGVDNGGTGGSIVVKFRKGSPETGILIVLSIPHYVKGE
jgi:hypothetical protein